MKYSINHGDVLFFQVGFCLTPMLTYRCKIFAKKKKIWGQIHAMCVYHTVNNTQLQLPLFFLLSLLVHLSMWA